MIPRLGQKIYVAYSEPRRFITQQTVLMKGKEEFAIEDCFNSTILDQYRHPIRFDEYGTIWFKSLKDAKQALNMTSNEKLVQIEQDYWEIRTKTRRT